MFGLLGSGSSNSRNNENAQKSYKEMSPKERRAFDRKKRQQESDREWDHLMDLDTLGFFDD